MLHSVVYVLDFLWVAADRKIFQRYGSREVSSIWKTYTSNGTAAVRSCE
jgi:hypothetical protein